MAIGKSKVELHPLYQLIKSHCTHLQS